MLKIIINTSLLCTLRLALKLINFLKYLGSMAFKLLSVILFTLSDPINTRTKIS